MNLLDWIILLTTLLGITGYGIWKTRGKRSEKDFISPGSATSWWAIGLSIMATQASAITFLSTPGLGYSTGLLFAQFYFGMPIAILIIALFFVPVFKRLKVYTAYEYLENRFDLKTRWLAAALFLIQRGLAAGITIYAPSIILTKILGWSLTFNILLIGILVIIYTVSGGTEAVTQTHKQQMTVVFLGMFAAFFVLVYYIRQDTGWGVAMDMARISGRLDALVWPDFSVKVKENVWSSRYNIWSGIIGGTFLMLSYFGTDQSQVQRYLSGKSVREIRTGLFFNAIVKIPMQYFILFIGVLTFIFYQTHKPPVHFNVQLDQHLVQSDRAAQYDSLKARVDINFEQKQRALNTADGISIDEWNSARIESDTLKKHINRLAIKSGYKAKVTETDYVFITFIMDYLPIGLVGLLLAVIFSAAMSSTSAELNALATTTGIDFYRRIRGREVHNSTASSARWFTFGWGVLAIAFALFASMLENLVEAVNILGSLFYGTILGIFLVGFGIKYVRGQAVFMAAILAESVVIAFFLLKKEITAWLGFEVEFLWYNVIGCLLVVLVSLGAQIIINND